MGVFSLNGKQWVKTKGFKWDFEQDVDHSFYSSSNEIDQDYDNIQIETHNNQFVLMSLTLKKEYLYDININYDDIEEN